MRTKKGWFWTCEKDGTPKNRSKLTYGHSFAVYCLSEYAMASGDPGGLEWALRTWELIQTNIADNQRGGYYEFLEEDWSKKRPGKYGGDRKSFDVHMHLMEAFTNLYEATGDRIHRDKTIEVVDLIFSKMVNVSPSIVKETAPRPWAPSGSYTSDHS